MSSLAGRVAHVLQAAGWPAAVGGLLGGVAGGAVAGGTEAGLHGAAEAAVTTVVCVVLGAAAGNALAALVRWQRPWYVRLLLGLAAGVAVVIAVIFGVFQFGFDEGGKRDVPKQTAPDAAMRAALARQFAPILKTNKNPGELFLPIGRPVYVDDTELKERVGAVQRIVDGLPSVRRLPSELCTIRPGCGYFLDVRGAEPDPGEGPGQRAYDALEEKAVARGGHRIVYSHVTKYDDSGDYAVQYWFLYFFNYRLNEHESDWEQITVHLDPNRLPVNVLYSAHISGHVRTWRQVQTEGDHPIVYVALGSHANFFAPGRYQVPVSCKSVAGRRVCVYESATCDRADGRGPTLRLGYELRELTGPVFSGSYGSGNYVLGKKRPDVLSDPRTRAAWLDPLARLEESGRGEKERRCRRS